MCISKSCNLHLVLLCSLTGVCFTTLPTAYGMAAKTALLVEWEDARWVACADDSFQRPTEPESVNPFFSCALYIDFFYITTNG